MAVVAGCTTTVDGTARPVQSPGPDASRSYGYVDDRCGLLHDETVAETVGAEHVVRPYSGAGCQYVLMRDDTAIDATFAWFETGSLDRERTLAADRGATITDTDVERHQAFLARRDITGAACSATAAAEPGVLSWWVQFRNRAAGDPCAAAEKLLSATLQADM